MSRTLRFVAVALLVAGGASAQNLWSPEIGIQGGFARAKPAGTGATDHIDFFDVPGQQFVGGLQTYGNLFAIIPWQNKLAVEPSIAASQLNAGAGVTTARLGLRLNYALTPKVYAAAGGVLLYLNADGQNSTNVGIQAGLGYRTRLVGRINGRVEAHVATVKGTDELGPHNVYGVLVGVSSPVGRRVPPAPARRGAPARAWQPVLGVAGGYITTHFVGDGGDLSGLALPGIGGSLTSGGFPVTQPPTLFVILPIGRKIAVEPGLDLHRVQEAALGETRFSGNLGARLNYAVVGGWYAAAGANLNYIKVTGQDAATMAGATVAWGYRFPLSGSWGGRVEFNYLMMGRNEDLGIEPQNTLGVLFGLTMPLR
ncbi:MAG: hypothetical protein ACREMJ_03205 [Gemmatimonadales bacterium]